MLLKKFSPTLLLLAGSCLQAAEPLLVPTPRASVLATTATNRPFLAAAQAQQPVDLAARGYIESELLLRGYANIYDWAGVGSELTVREANQPFATRLLVRRPREAGKFSGRVIVELLNPGGNHDSAPLWGFSFEHFLRRGDVWVGVTVNPIAAATLQKFDPVRYGALSFAFRQAEGCAGPKDAESGLAFDAIAQAGALLRSSSKENPLLDLNPQRLVVAGYSQAGGYVTTFANALHGRLRLGNDAPIFDGYLNAAGSMVATPINQCAPALPESDPRHSALPRDVPFVTAMTEADFNRAPALRREDSDAAGDVFRLYEIAGAAHSGAFAAGTPAPADLATAGLDPPAQNLCREPRSDLPLGYAFNAIWQQFDELLVQKQPMSSLPRIETDAAMAPKVDATGNALGGWRLPQLEVPVARYTGRSTPAAESDSARRVCELTGSMQRFDAAKLKGLYRDRAQYLRQFNAAVDQALLDRRLVKEDADALKASGSARRTGLLIMGADGFLRGHQVSRVLGVAVPLAMFLVWWGVWGTRGDVVSVTEVSATVVSDDGKTCLVQVESGEQVRILKPRSVTVGMRLQLRRTEHDDGELRFDLIGRAEAGAARMPQAEEG